MQLRSLSGGDSGVMVSDGAGREDFLPWIRMSRIFYSQGTKQSTPNMILKVVWPLTSQAESIWHGPTHLGCRCPSLRGTRLGSESGAFSRWGGRLLHNGGNQSVFIPPNTCSWVDAEFLSAYASCQWFAVVVCLFVWAAASGSSGYLPGQGRRQMLTGKNAGILFQTDGIRGDRW